MGRKKCQGGFNSFLGSGFKVVARGNRKAAPHTKRLRRGRLAYQSRQVIREIREICPTQQPCPWRFYFNSRIIIFHMCISLYRKGWPRGISFNPQDYKVGINPI